MSSCKIGVLEQKKNVGEMVVDPFSKAVEQRGENFALMIFFDNPIKNLVKSCRQILCEVTRTDVLFSVVTQSILKLFQVKVKGCLGLVTS